MELWLHVRSSVEGGASVWFFSRLWRHKTDFLPPAFIGAWLTAQDFEIALIAQDNEMAHAKIKDS